MFQKLSCLTDKVSAICLVVIVGDADTIPKSVSELSRKKTGHFWPVLTSLYFLVSKSKITTYVIYKEQIAEQITDGVNLYFKYIVRTPSFSFR